MGYGILCNVLCWIVHNMANVAGQKMHTVHNKYYILQKCMIVANKLACLRHLYNVFQCAWNKSKLNQIFPTHPERCPYQFPDRRYERTVDLNLI